MKNSEIRKIRVSASGEYDVLIGRNLIENAGEYVKGVVGNAKIALVTDDTVDALYADTVVNSIKDSGLKVVKFVFLHGEESKNLNTYGQILNFLADNQLTRTDALVALGGGVVGDMAGFAAATYLRGIKYIQIPTTLLSQIDSSVGGKTAIDLPSGKNLVGAFKQPSLVLCDTDTLKTLPKETFIDGMGEAAKYALLDKKVFDLLSGEEFDIEDLVYLSVDYKRMVVEADEFESGMRKLLNLGHTPAHGIENLSEYKIAHGRAVAMGLDIILKASLKNGYIDGDTFNKMKVVVKKCVGENPCLFDIIDIADRALVDKKRNGDYITLIAVYGVGDCRPVKIPVTEIKEFLS